MNLHPLSLHSASEASWRHDAVRIVEELFPVTPSAHWDLLLELRDLLRRGENWNRALDVFLSCRQQLEADHYLPFYRLRRLLSASLRVEAIASKNPAAVASLAGLLRQKIASFADLRRTVRRELFEHELGVDDPAAIAVRIVPQWPGENAPLSAVDKAASALIVPALLTAAP